MKAIRYSSFLFFLFFSIAATAQVNGPRSSDSTVRFTVFGACTQCKDRIEKVVKLKGVKYGVWDVDSKQLKLIFDPAVVSLEKIGNRIVAAGHDLDNKKAKAQVYNDLPACCHYREMDFYKNWNKPGNQLLKTADSLLGKKDSTNSQNAVAVNTGSAMVRGVVLESNRKGDFIPLPGASIVWAGTNAGTTTDQSGVFSIKKQNDVYRLVVSYTGYVADTLNVTDVNDIKIILGNNKKLGEVVVSSKIRSSYYAMLNPIRTQMITEKELFKAACCNLSESFETNPSVDVSYNDAVTGSKQIQLLGLSGNYTQLTVENLPGPRGIATPLGLNSIAGPWVESIQLTKGIGSVANGYESIAGQINVELKKPENAESLYANAYINDFGKTDLNLNLAKK